MASLVAFSNRFNLKFALGVRLSAQRTLWVLKYLVLDQTSCVIDAIRNKMCDMLGPSRSLCLTSGANLATA